MVIYIVSVGVIVDPFLDLKGDKADSVQAVKLKVW